MQSKFEIYQTGNSLFSNKKDAVDLSSKSSIGEIKSGKVSYSVCEALYLLDRGKVELLRGKTRISFHELLKKHKSLSLVYEVFSDLKDKGYILKEGLKFGADFRVYMPGQHPGKSHAKYLLYVTQANKKLDLKDFAAKARVAHSTNKTLLIAIVDSEGDISYYEVNWKSKS